MTQTLLRPLLLLAIALGWTSASVLAQPVQVAVRRAGETIVVDVTARVAASPGHVWAVLTDYEHMAEFLPAVRESRVLSRHGNTLEVAQTGGARRAFLDFTFSSVRSVELTPESEIRSRLVRGDFKSYEFTTRLLHEPASGAVTITHHGEYIPNLWVPPLFGPSLIEAETHKQYGHLIAEILRRQAGAPRAAPAAGPASSP